MWTFLKPLSLNRYLIALRVNSSLVHLPSCLAAEISLVLGTTIINRLPTREAKPWTKALAPWNAQGGAAAIGKRKRFQIPDAAWPMDAVIFVYPGKHFYGKGELIFFELKLAGESADHALFLEIILSALEEAGAATKTPWYHATRLWGHYDIQAVYAAHGSRWEPFVQDGRLDLSYRPTPTQWADQLSFDLSPNWVLKRLTWVAPFDFGVIPESPQRNRRRRRSKSHPAAVPSLRDILEALMQRVSQILPGRYNTPDDFWGILGTDEQFSLTDAIGQASETKSRANDLSQAPKGCPGRLIGHQTFAAIPLATLPYLQLASILHVGHQTHFGCGTFRII